MNRWEKIAARTGEMPAPDQPVVLSVEGTHGLVVHDTNRMARLAGVTLGARVTDMRALCPNLRVVDADPGQDAAALSRMMLWARRWCPWTATDGPRGLVLDTTGADHLWGGEVRMLETMQADLAVLGYETRLALAPTRGAAWALAHHGPVRAIAPAEDLPRTLAPLPVAGLRLPEDVVLLLHRLGLKTIGALAAVPRLSLARRFRDAVEANPLLRLDQALGHLPEPVSPPGEMPEFRTMARLAEPILDPTHFLPDLTDRLCADLEAERRGARRLRLSLFRTDGEVQSLSVAMAAASRESRHFQRLFIDRLEQLDAGFGFDLIVLEALVSETLAPAQTDLGGKRDDSLPLAELIDRLVIRFGAGAISCPEPVESHIPERAERRRAPTPDALEAVLAAPRPRAERPERLLEHAEEIRVLYAVPEGPPAQFVWRKQTHRVARHAGPERIAPEWWQDKPGTRLRDYYKVEVESGQRFWLYREGLAEDGRGGPPRWFVQGLFC
jgi:protein ImuB